MRIAETAQTMPVEPASQGASTMHQIRLLGMLAGAAVALSAIATTTKTGITKPKDLEGKTLGAPAADGAFAQWKAFVKENGIDESKVKIENIGFPVREPMLADGKVHAITGFSFSMHYNLLQKGLKPEEIKILLMADHGLVLYGNAVM